MAVIKDRDAVIKKLEEAELEMSKTKENHKQERSKLYGQIKEARKLIEDLEADKGLRFIHLFKHGGHMLEKILEFQIGP